MLAAQHELELSAALELSVKAGLASEFGLGGAGLLELRADEEPTAVEDMPTGGASAASTAAPPMRTLPEPPVFERGEVRGCSARASRRRRPSTSTTRPSCSTHSPRVVRRARGHQARDIGSLYAR